MQWRRYEHCWHLSGGIGWFELEFMTFDIQRFDRCATCILVVVHCVLASDGDVSEVIKLANEMAYRPTYVMRNEGYIPFCLARQTRFDTEYLGTAYALMVETNTLYILGCMRQS